MLAHHVGLSTEQVGAAESPILRKRPEKCFHAPKATQQGSGRAGLQSLGALQVPLSPEKGASGQWPCHTMWVWVHKIGENLSESEGFSGHTQSA